jgi:NADPH2:quinone reductase
MKAWIIKKMGSINDLEIGNVPIEEPKKGQARIKVKAVSLNPIDYKRCSFIENKIFHYPYIPGLDVAGVVDKISSESTDHDFKVGDIVYFHAFLGNNGGFSEYCISDLDVIIRLPGMTVDECVKQNHFVNLASLPTATWTAYNAIFDKLKLSEKSTSYRTVVVTAASGGVGSACLQLLKAFRREYKLDSMKIIGTCSKKNFDFIRTHGADFCIDYLTENIEQRVKELSGIEGCDVWIDCVDTNSVDMGIRCLGFQGELVSMIVDPLPATKLPFEKALTFHQVALGWHYLHPLLRCRFVAVGKHVLQMYLDGLLKPTVTSVIKFEEIKEKLIEMQNKKTKGKIVFSW